MKKAQLMILLGLAALLAGGCNLSQPATPTPTLEALTETPTAEPTVTATAPAPEDIVLMYESPEYGFAFDYPGSWSLEVLPAGTSGLNKTMSLSFGTVRLDMEYGYFYEINGIQAIELPSGEWRDGEPVTFLGQPLAQAQLVEDERVKMVMFPSADGFFQVDDLFFRFTLKETGPLAQNEIDLNPVLAGDVNGILQSFTRIERSGAPQDPYPGWAQYLNLAHGFALRYPSEWAVEETQVEAAPSVMADALVLTRDHSNLMLIYHFNEEYIPHNTQILGGLLVDDGRVNFLGTEIPKLTLVYGGNEKGVLYNGLEAFRGERLTFHISLFDNRAGIGYDALETPDDIQVEAEAILASVRQFPGTLKPAPAGVKSEGREIFLTFGSCFDLDEGQQVGEQDAACDFKVAKPASGSVQVNFQPAAPAAFGFSGAFSEQPDAGMCAALQGLSSAAETIAPLDARYICYQTNAGRYGALIFRALTSDGATFDWQTFTTAGPLQTAGAGENAAITLKDVTVPDGTVFKAGESFEKTWQLMNTGKTTWTTDFAVRFKEGDRLGAAFEVALPKQVPPGGAVNITVPMTAPQEPGEYISHWVLRDAQGRPFGVGKKGDQTFWAQIVVEAADPTEEPSPTPEPGVPVVETTLVVEPVTFSGACPASLAVSFSITTEGVDRYTYELVAGAAQAGFEFYLPDPKEVQLGGTGLNTKTVAYTLTMQNSVEGWLQVEVTGPVEYTSPKVYFTVKCE